MFSKKLVAAALAVSGLVASSNALAISQFDLDLTAYGFDRIENIDLLDITGTAFINTPSGIAIGHGFGVNAEYKVTAPKNIATLPASIPSLLGSSYDLYIQATGLTGSFTSVSGPLGFEFAFDAGVGSVEFFIDTIVDSDFDAGSAIKIADLKVEAGSSGESKGPAKVGTKGDLDLTLAFTWAPAGVWFDAISGTDASSKIAANQFLALTNQDFTTVFANSTQIVTSVNGIAVVDIPEPAPVALLGLGLLGFAFSRRRKA